MCEPSSWRLESEVASGDPAGNLLHHRLDPRIVLERGLVRDVCEEVVPRRFARLRDDEFVRILCEVGMPLLPRNGLPSKSSTPARLLVAVKDHATRSAKVYPEDVAFDDIE